MSVIEDLRGAGVAARVRVEHGRHDLIDGYLELDVDGQHVTLAIEQKTRAPYPNEVPHLQAQQERIAQVARPLLAAPFISSTVGEALAATGWSWADEHGNYSLVAPGLRLRHRSASKPARAASRNLSTGSGSGAIIRQLIDDRQGQPIPAVSALARITGVSQPRASQVIAKLSELGFVAKSADGERRLVDRESLLDRFLAEYRGPGGSTRCLNSLDAPLVTALRAAKAAHDYGDLVVSADVGPDLIAPWRKPTTLILYSRGGVPDNVLGAVPADSRESANVLVRTPHDASVFPAHRRVAEHDGVEIPLADPVQMLWDLLDLGGAEREEAAGVLREWIVGRP
jgi:DNA-binding transcriptional ArsR family regulator